jgi:hypothetical protein
LRSVTIWIIPFAFFRENNQTHTPWERLTLPRTEYSEDSLSSREQSYRRTLQAIDDHSTTVEEPAVHGGLILLEYPRNRKDIGFSTDYEVAKLQTTTSEGHRLVTLRLRTSPEVKGREREDCTFVFDADDLFVVRSLRGEGFNVQYDYDHEGGRPIFRALTGGSTSLDATTPKWSTRLEVTECRFGPIPESEFAPESFLGRLEPDGIVREHVGEPSTSTATLLDRYWLAFVVGGMSLAGGSGLALGSRARDRRALRTDQDGCC